MAKSTVAFLLFLVALIALAGCGSVLANGPFTVITTPTQITTDQEGDFVIQCGGSLYGPPHAVGAGVKVTGNITIVCAGGLVQNLFIEGCVNVNRAARSQLDRIWVQHCQMDGISVVSDPITASGGNQSCCLRINDVVSFDNAGSGLGLYNTADVFISNSEFEGNRRFGVELHHSPTARAVHSDFGGKMGGSGLGGFFADPRSDKLILTNIQFGNNNGPDLQLQSDHNVLEGLSFIGPSGYCSIQSSPNQVFGAIFDGPRSRC